MSVAETEVAERPAPIVPTPREVLARSKRLAESAADLHDEDALRMERDRMAHATVHSVRISDGYARKYADASDYAERLLRGVVAEKAAERTHGFARKLDA